jgi:hypothetical protein
MKQNALSIISVAIVAFLGGTTESCSVSAAESVSVPGTISVPVYFLSATGNPLPPEEIPRGLQVQLGAIQGSFGGSPDAPLQSVRVDTKNEIRLDLAELSAKLGTLAAPFRERSETPLELTPSGARFARVSTGASAESDALIGLAVVFWDLEANGSLVPVYCDQPCRLRAPKFVEEFDLDVPSPGLVWMLNKKSQDSRFIHTRSVNPHPVIIIAPPEALDKILPSALVKTRPSARVGDKVPSQHTSAHGAQLNR